MCSIVQWLMDEARLMGESVFLWPAELRVEHGCQSPDRDVRGGASSGRRPRPVARYTNMKSSLLGEKANLLPVYEWKTSDSFPGLIVSNLIRYVHTLSKCLGYIWSYLPRKTGRFGPSWARILRS
jgi:hypothetical protein